MYEEALDGVGVVRCPELGDILKAFVVDASAASRAHHHGQAWVLSLDALKDVVQAAHIVDIKMCLLILEIRRIGIHDGCVAVPFEESDLGVLGHEVVYDAEDEVLNLGVGKVERELIAEEGRLAARRLQHPVRVTLVEFALGIDHLGLYPDAEADAFLAGSIAEAPYAVRQFRSCLVPVAQSCVVGTARVFIGKPSVVEQEHVHTEAHGIVHEGYQFVLVEIEIGGFPVVEQRHTVGGTILELVASCPVVHVVRCLLETILAEGEVEVGCAERLVRRERAFGVIGVDA